MRTTIDIDEPILTKLRTARKREGKSLTRITNEVLALGLSRKKSGAGPASRPMRWNTKSMNARIDLADRDALYDAMDGGDA